MKAFCAGLAAALPSLLEYCWGNLEYGLIAGMGDLPLLYVFNIPYAQRAKKLFFVVLGMTLVSTLGSLATPYPLAVAILMGIIGATAIFIFGALKIKGPSAIFFVLVFAMTTGMPVEFRTCPATRWSCISRRCPIVGHCYDWLVFEPTWSRKLV